MPFAKYITKYTRDSGFAALRLFISLFQIEQATKNARLVFVREKNLGAGH